MRSAKSSVWRNIGSTCHWNNANLSDTWLERNQKIVLDEEKCENGDISKKQTNKQNEPKNKT